MVFSITIRIAHFAEVPLFFNNYYNALIIVVDPFQ